MASIVAAAQEERFTRKKHDPCFPRECHPVVPWPIAGVAPGDVDHVVFYDKPFLKFERLLETYLAFAPRGFTSFRTAMPVWLSEKLFQKDLLRKELHAIRSGFRPARRSFCSPSTISATRPAPSIPRPSTRRRC